MEVPSFILKAAMANKTSLGDQKAFPPDDEENFITKIVRMRFNEISEKVDVKSPDAIRHELVSYINRCRKIESADTKALEKLCLQVITRLFRIPKNTIDLSLALTGKAGEDKTNFLPERMEDFSFDSIKEMDRLTEEIYKRRMLDCLIIGASMHYSSNIESYVSALFKINPELPSLYSRILDDNAFLMFTKEESLDPNDKGMVDGGSVDVYLGGQDTEVRIKANGIMMPVLLEEGIKGILELAISHGLPKSREKAEYVIKKSDFRLAKLWDQRLGTSLWGLVSSAFNKAGFNPVEIGLGHIFMEISMLKPSQFNQFLREVFGKTRKGISLAGDLAHYITEKCEEEGFEEYMREKDTGRYPIMDGDEYFSANELSTTPQ